MKKNFFLFLLSALIALSAGGCSDLLNIDELTETYKNTSEPESSLYEHAENDKSSQEIVSTGSEESSDVSVEPSVVTQAESDYARQYLYDYIESAEKNGTQKIVDSDHTVKWKILQYKIDDFNFDGSPELVIQYSCQGRDDWDEQGIALEIVRFEDGDLVSYKRTSNFSDYVRFDGAGYIKHEIVDELYLDGAGNLGILSTKPTINDNITLTYNTYTLEKGSVHQKQTLSIRRENYRGRDNLDNPVYSSFAVIDNECFVYSFFTRTSGAQTSYISRDNGIAIQREILKCEPLSDFAVPDAIGHELETKHDYNTGKVEFCDIDEIDSVYLEKDDN